MNTGPKELVREDCIDLVCECADFSDQNSSRAGG